MRCLIFRGTAFGQDGYFAFCGEFSEMFRQTPEELAKALREMKIHVNGISILNGKEDSFRSLNDYNVFPMSLIDRDKCKDV